MEPVHVQIREGNDANGITWIKLDCLEDCIKSGHIVLNQHCNQVLKKFLGRQFTKSDFVKVRSRRKN